MNSLSKFPIFKKKDEKCFLALDIGTEAVKSLTFRKGDDRIIVIGKFVQYLDELGLSINTDFDPSIIKKAISKVLEKARSKKGTEISSVLLKLPANVSRSEIISVLFKRENHKKIITEKEERDIYEKISEETKKRAYQNFSEKTGILSQDIQLIDLEIIQIKIDGYEVSKIKGLAGNKIGFQVLISYVPKYYMDEIKKMCQELNLKIFKFFHDSYGIKYFIEKEEKNGIFLDIGGKVTQIFLAREAKLEKIGEFPIGSHFFSLALSQNLGMSIEGARILKETYSKRLLSEEVRRRIRQIFSYYLIKWFESLKTKLREEKLLLPSNFFLVGGGSELPEMQEILSQGDWGDLSFISQPEARLLLPKDLKNIVDETKSFNSSQDLPLLFLCYSILFIEK